MDQKRERCICAAVKRGNRVWYGHRHGDALRAMREELSWTMSRKRINETGMLVQQGFVTTHGRFVSRAEGRELQDAAGIKSKNREGYMTGTLFSEDLY